MKTLVALPKETQGTAEETFVLPNKYRYPEFAGWNGERYLKKLLRQILPMALYRTWEIFVDHQAIGNECYLGVTRLAEIAGRTTRTMEKNLASLCAKQLLAERAERKVFRSSTGVVKSKVVIVKDFAGLYDLAHEYHEWLNTDEYIAADREMITFMERSPSLIAKLRRFDNYRKVLYTRLPGPLSQAREEDRWFTEYQTEQYFAAAERDQVKEAKQSQRGAIPAKDPTKHLANDMAKGSTKRITKLNTRNRPEGDSFDSASSSSSKKPFLKNEESSETSDERQQRTLPIPLAEPMSEAQGKNAPMSLTSDPLVQTSCSRAVSDNQAVPSHLLASSFAREIAAPFGDLNPKGTHTRVISILKEARLDQPADVLLCLIQAYVVARDTRAIRPEHCRETGHANRMPLFCAMFQRFVDARAQGNWWDAPTWQQVEDEIATDDRLALWWSEHQPLVGEAPSPSPDESAVWHHRSDARLSGEEQEMAHQTHDMPSRRARISRLSQTNEQREMRAARARSVLRRLSHIAIPIQGPIILWEHVVCGCPLYYQNRGKEVCALCFPDPDWPGEVLGLLHSIVEGETATSNESERTEDAGGHATNRMAVEVEEEQSSWSRAAGWSEREEAYTYGVRLLEVMKTHGYLVEVRLRLTGSWYQVVLIGEDCKLVLESPEHVEYVVEQASKGVL